MVVSSRDVGTEDGTSPLYGMSLCRSLFKSAGITEENRDSWLSVCLALRAAEFLYR